MNNIDHQLAEKWIKPKSRVLDLGCGDGTLLLHLQKTLGVTGYGLEIDEAKINEAISKGLNIIEQDLNDGLARFSDNSFDTVVMARALQAVKSPISYSSTCSESPKKASSPSQTLLIGKTACILASKASCQ